MSDFDIQIQVNGSRCKQYHHDGRIYVEAKEGSEYTIEVKNNTWKRIMAVCSVDGLGILDGKPAHEDSPGYVINGYGSNKYDGFRVSDDKVAKFVFTTKDKKDGYSADKDSAQKNVGVIGVRIYNEVYRPPIPAWTTYTTYLGGTPRRINDLYNDPHRDYPTIWCNDNLGGVLQGQQPISQMNAMFSADNAQIGCDVGDESVAVNTVMFNSTSPASSNNISTKGIIRSARQTLSCNAPAPEPKGFDMATKWGDAKESKVVEVSFERGLQSLGVEIFYASRQSLIEMGVPIGPEKQVSFPKSFADDKYAKPPKNWVG